MKLEKTWQAELMPHAQAIADEARAIAPVYSGRYRRSIVAISSGFQVVVAAKDWKSHLVEWGSVNRPAKAVLRRAVAAAGYRLTGDT